MVFRSDSDLSMVEMLDLSGVTPDLHWCSLSWNWALFSVLGFDIY